MVVLDKAAIFRYPRQVGREPGGDGAAAGQGGRQRDGGHGQLRPPRRGNRDQSQRSGPGVSQITATGT